MAAVTIFPELEGLTVAAPLIRAPRRRGAPIPNRLEAIFPELEGLPGIEAAASSTVPVVRAPRRGEAARSQVQCPECKASMQISHLKHRHVCKIDLRARAVEMEEQARKRFYERTGSELPDLPFRSKTRVNAEAPGGEVVALGQTAGALPTDPRRERVLPGALGHG